MKRSKTIEVTYIGKESDPEPEKLKKIRKEGRFNDFFMLYFPEIMLTVVLIEFVYRHFHKLTFSEGNVIDFILVVFFGLCYYGLYYLLKPHYLKIMRNDTLIETVKNWNLVYFGIDNDEIIDILCMDDTELITDIFRETGEVYKIERIEKS